MSETIINTQLINDVRLVSATQSAASETERSVVSTESAPLSEQNGMQTTTTNNTNPNEITQTYLQEQQQPTAQTPAHAQASSSTQQAPASSSQAQQGQQVNAVVAKAKRAAVFLWTLLHAQVCTKNEPGQCHHPGCSDAKRVLHHINSCAAKGEVACPHGHNGCQQSRKLLSHYRKCREARARQRQRKQQGQSRLNQPTQTEACLICTLLSRHDKSVSQSNLAISSPMPPTPSKSQKRGDHHSLSTSTFDKIYSPQVNRRATGVSRSRGRSRSKSVQFDLDVNRETKMAENTNNNDSNIAKMPPPPNRSPTPTMANTSNASTAIATNVPRRNRTFSVGSIGSISCYDKHFETGRKYKYPFTIKDSNRPRAESLDERKMPSPTFGNDPTVEMELRTQRSDESEYRQVEQSQKLPFRKRSVSCSLIPAKSQAAAACDTIMEE